MTPAEVMRLQRAAGNRAVNSLSRQPQSGRALAVQRSVGYEFEVNALTSFQTKGLFTSVGAAAANPAKRKPLKKGDVMLAGNGFEMQADEKTGGGTDVEFVTKPFAEDDTAGLAACMADIVAICTTIDGNPGPNPETRTTGLATHGTVKKDDTFVTQFGPITAKPQSTLGVSLDKLFELMTQIGVAQGGEAALDTAARQPGREALMSHPAVGAMHLGNPVLPGAAVRRVGNSTTEVQTALTNYLNTNPIIWNPAPSSEIKGMLALLWTYIDAAQVALPNYAKAIAPIMARTDFAQMFKMLPPHEQNILKSGGGGTLVDIMKQCPAFTALNMTQPVFSGGIYANNAGGPSRVLDPLTREDWLKGITQGVDKLTRKKFPSKKKSTRGELESLGALGKKTEPVGPHGNAAPIFELRGLKGQVPFAQWTALAQSIRKYAKRKNRGNVRTFG
jgi:hypothetical protein